MMKIVTAASIIATAAAQKVATSCVTDADCGTTGFCRQSTNDYNGPKSCAAFSASGASCGGMMPPQMQTRCSQGLECVYNVKTAHNILSVSRIIYGIDFSRLMRRCGYFRWAR